MDSQKCALLGGGAFGGGGGRPVSAGECDEPEQSELRLLSTEAFRFQQTDAAGNTVYHERTRAFWGMRGEVKSE